VLKKHVSNKPSIIVDNLSVSTSLASNLKENLYLLSMRKLKKSRLLQFG